MWLCCRHPLTDGCRRDCPLSPRVDSAFKEPKAFSVRDVGGSPPGDFALRGALTVTGDSSRITTRGVGCFRRPVCRGRRCQWTPRKARGGVHSPVLAQRVGGEPCWGGQTCPPRTPLPLRRAVPGGGCPLGAPLTAAHVPPDRAAPGRSAGHVPPVSQAPGGLLPGPARHRRRPETRECRPPRAHGPPRRRPPAEGPAPPSLPRAPSTRAARGWTCRLGALGGQRRPPCSRNALPPSRPAGKHRGGFPRAFGAGGGAPVVVSRCDAGVAWDLRKQKCGWPAPGRGRRCRRGAGPGWGVRVPSGGEAVSSGAAASPALLALSVSRFRRTANLPAPPRASPAHIGMSRQRGLEQHLPGAQPPAPRQARPAGPLAALGVLAHAARTPVRCPRGHFGCRTSR